MESPNVIIDVRLCMSYQGQPGRQDWVTLIEYVCVDGIAIASMMIFMGTKLNMDAYRRKL